MLRDQPEGVLKLLEEAPERFQRHPDILMMRGQCYLAVGEIDAAVDDLEGYLRRCPDDTRMYAPLAMAYAQLSWNAHAFQAARRYLRGPAENQDRDGAHMMRELLEVVEPEVIALHTAFGVARQRCVEVGYFNEEGTRLMERKQFQPALTAYRKAIRIAPKWPAPYNNCAYTLALMGRLDEAIAQSREVLEHVAPGNLFAMANLVEFYSYRGERDSAACYVNSLQQQKPEKLYGFDLLDKVVIALAYVESAEALWLIADWCLTQEEIIISPYAWYALGVAAVETGHLEAARRCFVSAQDEGMAIESLQPIFAALDTALEGGVLSLPTTCGRLPYVFPALLFQSVPRDEFSKLLEEREKCEEWTDDLRRKRDAFLKRYPQIEIALINLFLYAPADIEDLDMHMATLSTLGTPRVFEVLKEFALGQRGSNDDRVHAANLLTREGWFQRGQKIRFWNELAGEWHEVVLSAFAIEEPEVPPYTLEVVEVLKEALLAVQAEELAQAESLFQKALELDPHCGQAAYDIGVLRLNRGKRGEGKAWITRAIEIEPDYLFAYATMANILIGEDKLDEAGRYLDVFSTQEVMSPGAYVAYQDAIIHFMVAREDFEGARRTLEVLEDLFLDHPAVERLREYIEEAQARYDLFGGTASLSERFRRRWLEGVHRRRNKMLDAPITPDADVRECLKRLTRDDALTETAKRLGVRPQGRKAELIENIADRLADPDILRELVEDLEQSQREALQSMAARGWIMPWEEFVASFGDDFDESPYWCYHKPESTPGILELSGLLAAGTYAGQRVAIVPRDLRPLLTEALKES